MFCNQCEQAAGGVGCSVKVEQKAVAILLSLLYLNIKSIYIGPTPPAFISKNVFTVLQDKFDLKLITTPEEDLNNILGKQKT